MGGRAAMLIGYIRVSKSDGVRRHLVALPARHPERSILMASTAQLYANSRATLYRLLRGDRRPKDAHRSDRGRPRSLSAPRDRTLVRNRHRHEGADHQQKGRHLSTTRILQLLVEHGVDLSRRRGSQPGVASPGQNIEGGTHGDTRSGRSRR
jgi:hypothetical protein